MVEEPLKTPLHAWHQGHGGRLVEFGGWSMPVQYTSIVEEHRAVRERVGLFDISHMGRLRVEGVDAEDWLDRATTNHVARLEPGQIQYSLMVAEDGGVLDDILVYRPAGVLGVVCNASNRAEVVAQLNRVPGGARRGPDRPDRADGDDRRAGPGGPGGRPDGSSTRLRPCRRSSITTASRGTVLGGQALASRTGYTGEDGFELIVPAERAEAVWEALLEAGRDFGIAPCGLGARDTLRFEAAMPLYGHELTAQINPYAAGLGWAVKLAKGEFLGREALRALKVHPGKARVGLELEGKRIARQGLRRQESRRRSRGRGHVRHVRADPGKEPGDGPGRPDRRVGRGPA